MTPIGGHGAIIHRRVPLRASTSLYGSWLYPGVPAIDAVLSAPTTNKTLCAGLAKRDEGCSCASVLVRVLAGGDGDGDGVVVGGGAAAARYLRPLIGKAIKPWPRFFGASFRFDALLSRHLG